jgi:hypothetical protein
MNAYLYAYIIILFIAVTPGILLHFPPVGNGYIVAITHGIIFALIWEYTHKYIYHYTYSEGFQIQGFQEPEYVPHPSIEQQKQMLTAEKTKTPCVSDSSCDTGLICRSGRCV